MITMNTHNIGYRTKNTEILTTTIIYTTTTKQKQNRST